jgi:hypothetical protein
MPTLEQMHRIGHQQTFCNCAFSSPVVSPVFGRDGPTGLMEGYFLPSMRRNVKQIRTVG